MEQNNVGYNNETASNLKFSGLSKLSIIFFALSIFPTAFNIFSGGLLTSFLNLLQISFLNFAIFGWFIVFLFASMVVSIIDLAKPNRKKSLSKTSLILCCIIFALLLLFIITLYTSSGSAY